MQKRYFVKEIWQDLDNKIVLLSGPRQVGKTTLAKSLNSHHQYLNFDSLQDRQILLRKQWDRQVELLIFDELHKMDGWKQWLKGIYDTEGVRPRILVTGSAWLETFTNVGDSLAGRFFAYRLHPFDIAELSCFQTSLNRDQALQDLLEFSSFPEPYLSRSSKFYRRWQKTHLDSILREDLISLAEVKSIPKIQTLILLLKDRIASPTSYSSLAEDLHVSYKTVAAWLELLEKLYILFRVYPFHRNIARANTKEPKYYFYDIARVTEPGARFENLVACALKKKMHQLMDTDGYDADLYYLRNRDGKEVDFLCVTEKENVFIEVKLSDTTPAKSLDSFGRFFERCRKVQLVANLESKRSTPDGIEVVNAADWLAELPIE